MGHPVIDPEEALLGALLRLPAPTVIKVLAVVTPAEVADPQLSALLRIMAELAHSGLRPDPAAVYARASLAGGFGEHPLRQLALRLHHLYTANPVPESVWFYLAAVLDGALRRLSRQAGDRLAYAAEHGDADAILTAALTQTQLIDELHTRITTLRDADEHDQAPACTRESTELLATAIAEPQPGDPAASSDVAGHATARRPLAAHGVKPRRGANAA